MSEQYVTASQLVDKYQISYQTLIKRAKKIGIRHSKGGQNNKESIFTSQQVEKLDRLNEHMKTSRNIAAFLLQELRTADGIPTVDYEETIDLQPVDVWEEATSDNWKDTNIESPLEVNNFEFIPPPTNQSNNLPPGVEKQLEVWFGMDDNYAPFVFEQFWKSGFCMNTKQIEGLIGEKPQGDCYQYDCFVLVKVQELQTGDRWKVNKIKLDTPIVQPKSLTNGQKLKSNHLVSNESSLLSTLENNRNYLEFNGANLIEN